MFSLFGQKNLRRNSILRISIPFNRKNSESCKNPLFEIIYKKDMEKFGTPRSYRMKCNGESYLLTGNHDGKSFIPNTNFIYVIFLNAQGNIELRIGKGAHYVLSGKSQSVYAAGEIQFDSGTLTEINDKSGSYYLLFNNDEERTKYSESIKKLLTDLDLPVSKFTPTNQTLTKFFKLPTGLFCKL